MAANRAEHRRASRAYSSLATPSCLGLTHLTAAAIRKEHAEAVPSFLASLRGLHKITIQDVQQDPALRQALRMLRAASHSAHSSEQQHHAPRIFQREDFQRVRALTPTEVSRDPALKAGLQSLRARTAHLRTVKESRSFSALSSQTIPYTHAGRDYVASMGPGWMGPHRVMQSHRRPLGPGKR